MARELDPSEGRDEEPLQDAKAFQAWWMSLIALILGVIALLVGLGLFDDKDPPSSPGPSIKVVRIKNSSGKKILSGVRVVAQTSATRLGAATSPMLLWTAPEAIPSGNDPGLVGDLLAPPRLPSPPWLAGDLDWGYQKFWAGVPPPYDRAWSFDITLEGQQDDLETPEDETESPTSIVGATFTLPDSSNGAYVKEVLAEVQKDSTGDNFRVHFTVNYWREQSPGWHFDEGDVTFTTGWLAKGTTGTP